MNKTYFGTSEFDNEKSWYEDWHKPGEHPFEVAAKVYTKKLAKLIKVPAKYVSSDLYLGKNGAHVVCLEFVIRGDNKYNQYFPMCTVVCRFSLSMLPGCCGYAISHAAWVNERNRNKGVAALLQSLKMDIAAIAGFSTIIATTLVSNKAENHILEKHGWRKIHRIKNKRTSNKLIMWSKDIK